MFKTVFTTAHHCNLSQVNPIHHCTPFFSQIRFNVSVYTWISKALFWVSNQNIVCISHIIHGNNNSVPSYVYTGIKYRERERERQTESGATKLKYTLPVNGRPALQIPCAKIYFANKLIVETRAEACSVLTLKIC
jgi:hypothetical protein